MIVIDDLDIGPTAQAAYRDALALAVHRAISTGRGLLLTARGDTAYLTYAHGLSGIATVEVTQIDAEEAVRMCLDHGCPVSLAQGWGAITSALYGGHPKLVQVRLAELARRGWPTLNAADLLDPSPAVTAARALARRLLSESLSPPMVEFVYILSESLVPLRRDTGILVAEAVEGISNAGDVLDNLIGTWIEYVEDGRLRVTRLLNGVVGDVWSPGKRRLAHLRLHDALLNQRTVTPLEAATLLFHAWQAENSQRLARHARTLSTLLDDQTTHQVDLCLQWLPLIALDVGQSITPDPVTNIMLRYLQFRVATTLESDQLPSICARWIDDIERIVETEARDQMSVLVWMAIGSAASEKIPMTHRLRAANGISHPPAAIYAPSAEFRTSMTKNLASIGLPTQATTAQVFILFAIRSVDSFDALVSLLRWLDQDASDKLRREFDDMLVWPIVQTMGAFVHTAWVKVCQTTKDWAPWLGLFERLDDYAQRHRSPCLGREVAKARAMILTEYLDDGNLALQVLAGAETEFGSSAVLTEQRANILYQIKDDEAALRIWEDVVGNPGNHFVINVFAYRRTALSAVRLKRWDTAERLFLEGSAWNDAAQSDIVRFGLRLDAALAASNGGFQNRASRHLLQAILGLPAQASVEDDARWEAVQRAASAICVAINHRAWNPTEHDCAIEVGFASAPASTVTETAPGQSVRTEITKALALHLVATLTTIPDEATSLLNDSAASKIPFVRLMAAESRLSVVYGRGAASDLIPALIAFDQSFACCLAQGESAGTPLDPVEQVDSDRTPTPERWFGLLTAAVICAGENLPSHAHAWLRESMALLGQDAELTHQLRLLIQGLISPPEQLRATAATTGKPSAVRIGAAARLHMEAQSAKETCYYQLLMTSALFSDESWSRQEIFNRHVAICFARPWRKHVEHRFQFYNPRLSVSGLIYALDQVESESGTLRRLLAAAANAVRLPLGEHFARVK